MKKDERLRLRLSEQELTVLTQYAAQEGEGLSVVVRSLIRDGLRFRAYIGNALDRLMVIGVAGTPAQDDIVNLARTILEKMRGEA